MKLKLALKLGLAGCAAILLLAGYSASSQSNHSDQKVITFAHGAPTGSGPAVVLDKLPQQIESATNKRYSMEVYGGGTLGGEPENIEAIEAGALDMAKVSGITLEGFESLYGVFGLPFLFEDEDHLYRAMNETNIVEQLNEVTYDKGFIMVGWYPSGARNFYTASNNPILSPDDLKGQKIRTMQNPSSTRMVQLLGGASTPMSSSETYTALQQGVIDGAENNELALTANSHKDVIKSYSYTEHQMIPDIFLMSTEFYETLSDEDYQTIVTAIEENNEEFRSVNQDLLTESRKVAEEAGVEFYDEIDKEPFREKVTPMYDDFVAKGATYEEVYETINSVRGSDGSDE
ncbi:MAG: TRAP transporter substrate-binding protein [Enterococcus sp.]